MILFDGKLYESSKQNELLEELKNKIPEILSRGILDSNLVIEAIDKLRIDAINGKFDHLLTDFPRDAVEQYKGQASVLLSKEMLSQKMQTELGDISAYETKKIDGFSSIKVSVKPLGVIFHIAAGNMDFLPAYSLAEGLLTGNINILKLPSADNGLSLKLITQLIEYEPELKDYIYVFDTSSTDVQGMRKMAELANAISVWGSDFAIDAVRNLAPSGVKLVEWGQKLGFCYVSDTDNTSDLDSKLQALATHIASTKQLLCSSCQVIYIDSDSATDAMDFAHKFMPFLEAAVNRNSDNDIGTRARDTLIGYTQKLKGFLGENKTRKDVCTGRGCSLILSSDPTLELSPMMCNVLIKNLPEDEIIRTLIKSKNYLQTAGLICPDDSRARLTDKLISAGLTRVTTSGNLSSYFPGEAHDGDYALRRYVRVVNVENT